LCFSIAFGDDDARPLFMAGIRGGSIVSVVRCASEHRAAPVFGPDWLQLPFDPFKKNRPTVKTVAQT
jgi:hypothetical protein